MKITSKSLGLFLTAYFTQLLITLSIIYPSNLSAQTTAQVTLEGTITMYMVTRYGDSLQELDRYRRTTKEGEYVAFILKTDKKMNVTQFIETEEELKVLVEYAESDETMQSEFLLVPNWDVFESFSEKDFAAQFAHKRVRVTGTLFVPLAGWHYVTPVRMDFSKVELVDSDLGNVNERTEESSDPTKYFFVFEDDSPERKAYAKELVNFVERLQHDETTFDADLSAKLDKLRISLLTSPDGKVKLYSWHDGDFGNAISFHTIYQTKSNGEFHAAFMEDYYQEPRKLYQLESFAGSVYLVNFFFQEGSWGFAGVNAFTMDTSGLLQPANIFECIPELHETSVGFSATLAADCSPETPSYWQEGAWLDNFFFDLTGKDFYMPHSFKRDETHRWGIMSDFYHRFTWDGNKFRYRQLDFNPGLAKYLPESGWLMKEFEWGDSIVRIDSVTNGSYRLIMWKKDKLFSSAPELILTQGRYDATKREYHFQNGDYEYVFNASLQQLQVLRQSSVMPR